MMQAVQSQVQQCRSIVLQMIEHTQQASQHYEMMLQQEVQNAQQLEQLAQRERQAAQMLQQALQGHHIAIQNMQMCIQLVSQLEQAVNQTMAFNASEALHQPAFGVNYPAYRQ